MTEEDPWPSEWLRGVLNLLVLRVLAHGPTYGYAIALHLADAGFGTLKGGTLYPLLGRFERDGLVTVEWRPGAAGPGRKYYLITEHGREQLRTEGARWAHFARLTAVHVTGPGDTSPRARATTTDPSSDTVTRGAR